jgi:glycosyltransferase involved in cell wall biosynthesis
MTSLAPVCVASSGMHFSVVTPTRNDLHKLRRCVGSVRGQAVDVRLEHLVQDARSEDGTAAWLADQADLNWRSEADAGMYDAIQRGWSRSTGEVLSWLNADEQYLPGTLAMVKSYFDEHPEADVIFGDYIVCDAEGRPIAQRQEIPFRRVYVANSFLNTQSCTLFFRRRLLEQGLLRFDCSLRYAADKDLMLQLGKAGVRIHHLRGYLALFGIDGSNLSTHPRMLEEAEQVRSQHGGFRSRFARSLVLTGRRVERFVRGAYASRELTYRFAVDETPTYREVRTKRLGGRYSLSDTYQG